MTEILELIGSPIVVCILAALIGIGIGLGFDEKSRLRGSISIVAAVASGLLIGDAEPETPLATPVLTLGFTLTVITLHSRATKRRRARSAD